MVDSRHGFDCVGGGVQTDGRVIGDDYNGEDRIWLCD